MYEQIREDTIYMMLYAVVAALNLVACCYLLFRRANAIAPDITSPVRLRRWTAAIFASITLSHLWYIPILFLDSNASARLSYLIGLLLDCITFFPLTIVVLITLLQDHRRSLREQEQTLYNFDTNAEAAVGTLQAGADIVLGPQNFVEAFDAVVKAVEDGRLSEQRIDQSVRRILKLKRQIGRQ